MNLLSKLISVQHSESVKKDSNNCFCEACGRTFESPIRLTNLSATPLQIYNACPFCFSKLDENVGLEEPDNLKVLDSKDSNTVLGKKQKSIKSLEPTGCPHYFGYLKKRPKNTPIPEACLTCEKMIQCVL